MTRRINPSDYEADYKKIAEGYYSAEYFNRAHHILLEEGMDNRVVMQLFQKKDAVICGIDEAAAVLKACTPWDELIVSAVPDGTRVAPWETIMHIEGRLSDFVHLESVYLGIIRDATTVATNVSEIVAAANGKQVLYLADRFNRYTSQTTQGYAAHVGGVDAVCTQAGVSLYGGHPIGTMPHALIAAFGGDVVEASLAFARHYPDVNLVSLVDFNNDCVTDALAVAKALGDRLWAVRLDTSEKVQDKSLWVGGAPAPYPTMYGVCPRLVHNVRKELDRCGYEHVKIVVSGGFNKDKITMFEDLGIPVDAYGVGSSMLVGGGDITADVVLPISKFGREYRPNDRLERLL